MIPAVQFHPDAERELLEAFEWYSERSELPPKRSLLKSTARSMLSLGRRNSGRRRITANVGSCSIGSPIQYFIARVPVRSSSSQSHIRDESQAIGMGDCSCCCGYE
jgi:hypothetical protein